LPRFICRTSAAADVITTGKCHHDWPESTSIPGTSIDKDVERDTNAIEHSAQHRCCDRLLQKRFHSFQQPLLHSCIPNHPRARKMQAPWQQMITDLCFFFSSIPAGKVSDKLTQDDDEVTCASTTYTADNDESISTSFDDFNEFSEEEEEEEETGNDADIRIENACYVECDADHRNHNDDQSSIASIRLILAYSEESDDDDYDDDDNEYRPWNLNAECFQCGYGDAANDDIIENDVAVLEMQFRTALLEKSNTNHNDPMLSNILIGLGHALLRHKHQ
jgi:hypothetical protein